MSKEQQKRHKLLSKLRLKMSYTAPVLALVAGGVTLQAVANSQAVYAYGEVPTTLLLASPHAEAQDQPEGEAEAEGEAEGESQAGAPANARIQAVSRPDSYVPGYDENGNNPTLLVERGKALFNDSSLSSNGLSCASCHGADGQSGYQDTFNQPYPHAVAVGTNMFGMETVHADEMVQLCMVAPMEAEPLDWESDELAALAAYVVSAQQTFAGEADGHCNS